MDQGLQRPGHDRLRRQRSQRCWELRLSAAVGAGHSPALAELPRLGLGIGLRNVHFGEILETWPDIDWFEAISENFMDSGGRPRHVLRRIAERYPVVLHGVSLSIGSADPLRRPYLARLKILAHEVGACWVSDHLCWTGVGGHNSHDLLPLPLNAETLAHVAARVCVVQDILERPLILENPSSYVRFAASSMDEVEFFRALCEQTGCGLLLDVNNVYVSCFNAGTDPWDYLARVPWERVVQLHLAGHQRCASHIVDTHDRPVCPEVWELFRAAWQRSEGAATLLEWDGQVPALARVHAEVLGARAFMDGPPASATQPYAGQLPTGDVGPLDLVEDERPSTPVDYLVPSVMAGVQLHEEAR